MKKRIPHIAYTSWNEKPKSFLQEVLKLATNYDTKSYAIVSGFIEIMQKDFKDFELDGNDLILDWEYDVLTRYEKRGGHDQSNLDWFIKNNIDDIEIELFETRAGLDTLYNINPKTFSFLNNKTIIDAGAYIGDSTVIFSNCFPQSKILAFECDPDNFKKLHSNIMHPSCPMNIKIYNYGLGDRNKEIIFEQAGPRSRQAEKGIKITLNPLDDIPECQYNVGLIKMDIEGGEQEALKGAERIIHEQKPILMICMYHSPEQFEELLRYGISIRDLGYDTYIRYTCLESPACDIALMAIPKIS